MFSIAVSSPGVLAGIAISPDPSKAFTLPLDLLDWPGDTEKLQELYKVRYFETKS